MLTLAGMIGHLVTAIGFFCLAGWLIVRHGDSRSGVWLAAASLGTATWAGVVALAAHYNGELVDSIGLFETLRNAGWAAFLVSVLRTDKRGSPDAERERAAVITLLGGVLLVQLFADIAYAPDITASTLDSVASFMIVLRIMAAVSTLLLIHNLYLSATPASRFGLRLLSVGLGAVTIYDLNLYTIAFLNRQVSSNLFNVRGVVMAIVLPLLILAAHRNRGWRIQLSHSAAFQTFALIGIGLYLVFMAAAVYGLRLVGGDWSRLLQIVFLFVALVASALFAISDQARAWTRVKIAKHFLPYKYDYRSEWLRFIRTVGIARSGYGELPERVIRAVATIVDSPGGLLFTLGEDRRFAPLAHWNMAWTEARPLEIGHPMVVRMANDGRIVNLDEHRDNPDWRERAPDWLIEDRRAWLIVPLIHLERLAGFLLLDRSSVVAELNWEDFDLLRTVGQQAASYIAEAQSQSALADAEKFEEFNRRFAFIMHDIKNLVSQLSLLSRNAERHADKPEFRVDMVATLQSSVGKMNDLLARLAQHNKGRPDERVRLRLAPLVRSVVDEKRRLHQPIELTVEGDPHVIGDSQRIEQIVVHIIQNAIDVSGSGQPVIVTLREADGHAEIGIADKGQGMAASFIRDQLFKPFVSTKSEGFGIGAYESREITRSMGGRIDVWSRENEGSIFTIHLPLADMAVDESHGLRAAVNGVK